MRVELRVENDGHDYEVAVECDQSVQVSEPIKIASFAMTSLLNVPVNDPGNS